MAISISARAIGGDPYQSDPAGLGELFCHRTLESLLPTRQTLGGAEDPAPSEARSESSRVWVGAVEYLETVRRVWPLQWLSRASGSAVGSPRSSGLITLDVKHTRERSAITPHAAFDVAGTGNVAGFTLRRRASPRPYQNGCSGHPRRVVSAAEPRKVVSIRTLMADVSCGSTHGLRCQPIP